MVLSDSFRLQRGDIHILIYIYATRGGDKEAVGRMD